MLRAQRPHYSLNQLLQQRHAQGFFPPRAVSKQHLLLPDLRPGAGVDDVSREHVGQTPNALVLHLGAVAVLLERREHHLTCGKVV